MQAAALHTHTHDCLRIFAGWCPNVAPLKKNLRIDLEAQLWLFIPASHRSMPRYFVFEIYLYEYYRRMYVYVYIYHI